MRCCSATDCGTPEGYGFSPKLLVESMISGHFLGEFGIGMKNLTGSSTRSLGALQHGEAVCVGWLCESGFIEKVQHRRKGGSDLEMFTG